MKTDCPITKRNINGGKRRGAGAKPGNKNAAKKSASREDAYERLAKAKADHEEYKAELARLKLREQAGEVCRVDGVSRFFATTIAVLTDNLRSVPDKAERSAGLNPDQAVLVLGLINDALAECKAALESYKA